MSLLGNPLMTNYLVAYSSKTSVHLPARCCTWTKFNINNWVTYTAFTLGEKSSSTLLWSSSISVYSMCKQVQDDLSHIKKSQILKLLFTNLFFKISWIIVIDLHFFCSVNRSRNRIHVYQGWWAIFYCIHPGYWWPVLEFEFRIGAINVTADSELIYANPWSSLK